MEVSKIDNNTPTNISQMREDVLPWNIHLREGRILVKSGTKKIIKSSSRGCYYGKFLHWQILILKLFLIKTVWKDFNWDLITWKWIF